MIVFRLAKFAIVAAAGIVLFSGLFFAPTAVLVDVMGELAPATAPTLRVMTYNVRVETASDGDNNWPNRAAAVAALIRYHQPDVLALQECFMASARELAAELPAYDWYARGSATDPEQGATNPVFYRKSRLVVIESRTLWLSETPETSSSGWDAQYPRVATLVSLREITTGGTWHLANVHLDHEGEDSRRHAGAVILDQFKHRKHAIVLGDFNSVVADEACAALTTGGLFVDARTVSTSGHVGLNNTYNGFRRNWFWYRKIDHILVSPDMDVTRHEIPGNTVNGRLPSDHFPVIAEVAP